MINSVQRAILSLRITCTLPQVSCHRLGFFFSPDTFMKGIFAKWRVAELPTSNRKTYQSVLIFHELHKQLAFFQLWQTQEATNTGSDCCELPFKTAQEEKEDSQETASSLAAAKEVCRCCSGDSFIRIGWLFFFNLQGLNYNSAEGFFSLNNIFSHLSNRHWQEFNYTLQWVAAIHGVITCS